MTQRRTETSVGLCRDPGSAGHRAGGCAEDERAREGLCRGSPGGCAALHGRTPAERALLRQAAGEMSSGPTGRNRVRDERGSGRGTLGCEM